MITEIHKQERLSVATIAKTAYTTTAHISGIFYLLAGNAVGMGLLSLTYSVSTQQTHTRRKIKKSQYHTLIESRKRKKYETYQSIRPINCSIIYWISGIVISFK